MEIQLRTSKATVDSKVSGIETGTTPLPRMGYSMKEAAIILGVSYISIQRLVKRGLLRASGALRHKIISSCEIQEFLARTTN